jgi:hypothetical protein
MEPAVNIDKNIENKFSLLSQKEKIAVISHGVAVRFSELNKRLFLAQSKVSHFEKKYDLKLTELEEKGLPDNADFEMHEEYIMWHHWTKVINKATEQNNLQPSNETCLEEVMEVILTNK